MILVVGATGALGGIVARTLLTAGQPVRVLVRTGSQYSELVAAGARPVVGDLKDPVSLIAACAGVTTVVTTANSTGRGGADTIDSVDRLGNRALVDAAYRAGVEHFVFVSALGASADGPVDFMRAKAETESHIRASGMSYTILQPDAFMEVWFGMLIGMPLQQGRPIVLIEPARARHSFLSIQDVAAFTAAAAAKPEGRNQIVPVGGPSVMSWRDVVAVAGDVLEQQLAVEYVPAGTPLPGLPDIVSQLAASFETHESVLQMDATAVSFGVRLTSAADCLRRMLRPGPGTEPRIEV
ncbi:MAG: SDR family oxidoreductase [Gemmatimonadota bacterium]